MDIGFLAHLEFRIPCTFGHRIPCTFGHRIPCTFGQRIPLELKLPCKFEAIGFFVHLDLRFYVHLSRIGLFLKMAKCLPNSFYSC